jgi:16S rRNA (guanine527-N7)-methyltransferase
MQDGKFRALQQILPDVSRETFERLLAYEALFLKWSKSINLAAPSTLDEFWVRHILDSAQLGAIHAPAGVWADIGSGGGLPGVVTAILMRETAGGRIHLIESNGKKAAFLRQALIESGGAGQVHACRIQEAFRSVGPVNVVTARALAPMRTLIALAKPWLDTGAIGLFHKGREYGEEMKVAGDVWHLDLVEHVSLIDRASVVLEIRSAMPNSGG